MLEATFLALVNRLLGQEDWARERLAPFAGRVVELRAPPLPDLRIAVRGDGLLAKDAADETAQATVTLRPGGVDVTGEENLAETVRFLIRNLRWDVEEELSRYIGDIAARRFVQGAKDLAAWQRDAGARFADSFGRYLRDEGRMLTPREEFQRFADSIGELRARLERLEKRLPPLA